MSGDQTFEFVRRLDVDTFASLGPDDHHRQLMLSDPPAAGNTELNYIRTPPGLGSPRGYHSHPYDQVLFMVRGSLEVEIEGAGQYRINEGDVVIYPAGVHHRNWNETDTPTIHLSLNLIESRAKGVD